MLGARARRMRRRTSAAASLAAVVSAARHCSGERILPIPRLNELRSPARVSTATSSPPPTQYATEHTKCAILVGANHERETLTRSDQAACKVSDRQLKGRQWNGGAVGLQRLHAGCQHQSSCLEAPRPQDTALSVAAIFVGQTPPSEDPMPIPVPASQGRLCGLLTPSFTLDVCLVRQEVLFRLSGLGGQRVQVRQFPAHQHSAGTRKHRLHGADKVLKQCRTALAAHGTPARQRCLKKEVDHADLGILLADTVDTADALLHLAGVPGQVVVDDRPSRLQVQTFARGVCAEQDGQFAAPAEPA